MQKNMRDLYIGNTPVNKNFPKGSRDIGLTT